MSKHYSQDDVIGRIHMLTYLWNRTQNVEVQ